MAFPVLRPDDYRDWREPRLGLCSLRILMQSYDEKNSQSRKNPDWEWNWENWERLAAENTLWPDLREQLYQLHGHYHLLARILVDRVQELVPEFDILWQLVHVDFPDAIVDIGYA